MILTVFFFALEMACRLGFTIMLQELFTKVTNLEVGNNKRDAYLYATFCGVVWLIAMSCVHNGFYEAPILINRIRSELIFLIFAKLSKISQYTVKSQELGKIMNLLSNDFNMLELKGPLMFISFVAPLGLTGVIAILVTNYGWPGILPLCVIIVFIPIQILVGKINSKYFEQVNVYKDQRVKVCT